jgi:hypothetical protein
LVPLSHGLSLKCTVSRPFTAGVLTDSFRAARRVVAAMSWYWMKLSPATRQKAVPCVAILPIEVVSLLSRPRHQQQQQRRGEVVYQGYVVYPGIMKAEQVLIMKALFRSPQRMAYSLDASCR